MTIEVFGSFQLELLELIEKIKSLGLKNVYITTATEECTCATDKFLEAAKRDDKGNSEKFYNGLLNQVKTDLRHLVNRLRLFLNLHWTLKCITSWRGRPGLLY